MTGAWVRSSSCNGASSCVEVSLADGSVLVRDSKLGDASPTLRFSISEWWSWLAAVKTNQLGTYAGPILLTSSGGESWQFWRDGELLAGLTFDRPEVEAFVSGVRGREFDPGVLAGVAPDRSGPGSRLASTVSRQDAGSLPV